MKTTSSIQQYVQRMPQGTPFTAAVLLKYGGRAAVDQTLSRLTSAGKIVKLIRGVYVRPEKNRFVGQVLPEPYAIIEAIAKKTNEIVQVSGAEAARQFGFSTQVPAQPVFLTTGTSRQFKIGSLEVTLKHVSRKKIPLPESKVGLAIVALWYLGKEEMTPQAIERIEKRLTHHEFEKFKSSKEYMPIWMSSVVAEYEHTKRDIHS